MHAHHLHHIQHLRAYNSIDGTQMGNMHLDKVFEMINGPAGSTLKMTFERNSADYDVTLTRGQAKWVCLTQLPRVLGNAPTIRWDSSV